MNGDWPTAVAIALIAFACAIYYTATAWFKHRERMEKIEQGIDPDQPVASQPPSDRVNQLASDPTKKIVAIKVYREETGASLAQAKQAVEALAKSRNDKPEANILKQQP